MSVSLSRSRFAVAFASLALLAPGCSFPEGDYGFPKEAGLEAAAGAPGKDAAAEDSSVPDAVEEEGEDSGLEAGEDVAEAGPDTPDDVPTEVQPDVAPEAAPDVIDAPVEAPSDAPPDTPLDVAAEAPQLPLLNVWHIPTNSEPPTVTMRNPRFPDAGAPAHVYFGVQPDGLVKSATLHWQWTGETSFKQAAFSFDSHNGNNTYWVAQFPMPARPVGTFRYYIEVVPNNETEYATTWLFGTDSDTNKTSVASLASLGAYRPDVRLPAVGEVVITEAMINALGGTPETPKEWFEVMSAAPVPITLNGCKLGDNSTTLSTITAADLILWPGVYAVFGSTADSANMGGFLPDHAYGNAPAFANTGDSIRVLLPDDTVIDQVTYGTGWPGAVYQTDGHSMQYKTLTPNVTDNDLPANWCQSLKGYGLMTSFGTPQAPTDFCAP